MRVGWIVLFVLVAGAASAGDVYHQAYIDERGVLHPGHYQTAPDGNPYNNYSTQGNVNPYTGEQGTVAPEPPRYRYPSAYQPPTTIRPPVFQPYRSRYR